ncbi:YbhB/YbcL family Raf kinase inhibitor-like protein [Aspergillus glaucus CBS 516.65]|uniref:Phosphatidylethanolamine-binding protein n=1 Tax=Aspergillus glaucus CBS 516.65 TaxID=1160497 RepID=A0A1L9V9F6_ASPGL|nr:hypothetical protein ASPGLDRAFT_134465 [Aspergillus glaucus CBS 516.65]OJJ80540.1 hypothetical protein ASPGLDRAFT_134465 [Aspergillus glaucus CBS 516.65]
MSSITTIEQALSLIENDSSKVLGLKIGSHTIKPGQYIPRAEANKTRRPITPDLTLPSNTTDKTYIAISLDIDAPFPSLPILGPILHWIQPGIRLQQTPYSPSSPSSSSSSTLQPTAPFVANYIGPAPPPGSAPHRYVFLLYEQPEGFAGERYAPKDGRELSNWYRMRFDLGEWGRGVGLGDFAVGNWFVGN